MSQNNPVWVGADVSSCGVFLKSDMFYPAILKWLSYCRFVLRFRYRAEFDLTALIEHQNHVDGFSWRLDGA